MRYATRRFAPPTGGRSSPSGTQPTTRRTKKCGRERELDIPPIVLSSLGASIAGILPDETRDLYAAWRESHDELAALSPRGVRRDSPDGVGHMIRLQRPDIVIEPVREVIGAAAKTARRSAPPRRSPPTARSGCAHVNLARLRSEELVGPSPGLEGACALQAPIARGRYQVARWRRCAESVGAENYSYAMAL